MQSTEINYRTSANSVQVIRLGGLKHYPMNSDIKFVKFREILQEYFGRPLNFEKPLVYSIIKISPWAFHLRRNFQKIQWSVSDHFYLGVGT